MGLSYRTAHCYGCLGKNPNTFEKVLFVALLQLVGGKYPAWNEEYLLSSYETFRVVLRRYLKLFH